jgi:hypothetical protein
MPRAEAGSTKAIANKIKAVRHFLIFNPAKARS